MHGHRVLERALVAEAFEDRRGACATSGRVDDEIGAQVRLFTALVGDDAHAGHAVVRRCRRDVDDVVSVEQRDAGEGTYATSDVALKERSARSVDRQARGITGSNEYMAVHRHVHPRQIGAVEVRSACGDELVEDARKQFVQDLRATHQQPVQMLALRHAAPIVRGIAQLVAFHDGDVVVVIGQHPRRQ